MVEYYYWEDNNVIRAKGLVEIRKKFIQRAGRNKHTNIFKKGHGMMAVGYIYYANGWVYKDYDKHKAYVIGEDGRAKYEIQDVFY